MGFLKALVFLMLFFFLSGFTYLDGRMYDLESNETARVQWDAVTYQANPSLPIEYHYRLNMFKKSPQTFYQEGATTSTEHIFTRPRTEFFRPEVRACGDMNNNGEIEPETECSEWAISTNKDYATVDGAPMGWWLYWNMPSLDPAGDGQITF